ncbi:Predicted arabinose efflux permease, MFS family [Chitinasiproducens palmae]|uniref:Predicted arabinose efflux permease, MFS family n=2 Tax=Chitinasiproducens palmae TaxID=1770053 RepID=A0A1H2PN69_9BURK|nr:Predicted arabinose efflux permease, MFS family [Chitinasiproducens palmae]
MNSANSVYQRPALWRVCVAAVAGSTIEGFDFLAYGTASALVFGKVFFANLDPTTATIASFGTFASGLLARPIGGVIFGHFGDRIGRKAMLSISLILMGLATLGIGLVPSYAAIGGFAPLLLILFRILQGVAFGGEFGGAILMAVEHAPPKWKGILGALPLAGVPMGLVLSALSFGVVTRLPDSDLLAWGWRLPFVSSVLLVIGGYYIRSSIPETPDFVEVRKRDQTAAVPSLEVLRKHWKGLLLTIGNKLGEVTLYYTVTVFLISYAGTLGYTKSQTLTALLIGAVCQVVGMLVAGWLCSRISGRTVARLGGVAMALSISALIAMIDAHSPTSLNLALAMALGVVHPLVYAPQAGFYSAQFPAEVRYSGLSLAIQVGAAVGGGIAPIVATALSARYGSLSPIAIYVGGVGLFAAVCACFMKRETAHSSSASAVAEPARMNGLRR